MPRLRLHLAVAPLIAAALLFTACNGDDEVPTPAPTATPPATATAPATPSGSPTAGPTETAAPEPTDTTVPQPGPDPDDWAVPVYPPDTRTEIDAVDRALEAVLTGDAQALAELAQYTERECTTSNTEGAGSFQCPEGVADETPLPVIQLAFCEGTFVGPDGIEQSAESFFHNGPNGPVEPLALWAVARIGEDPTLVGSRYRLLFAFPDGTGRQVWIGADGVTMLWWGCGEVPVTEMTAISSSEPVPEYELPPIAE